MKFNFGPIARTDAGGTHDTFNLASLPLHVMLDALMAATSRDEFVAWLWHDLFKPAFYWQKTQNARDGKDEFLWNHVPGYRGSPFEQAENKFADKNVTNIPIGFVSTHHARKAFPGKAYFSIRETEVMSDQADQVNLGAKSVYVQLAFIAEPASSTALVRSVIADSFVEAVTKSVAQALRNTLASKAPQFSRVRFVFETQREIKFSALPTDAEIWSQVGQKYDVQVQGNELIMRHVTPVNTSKAFDTEFVVDLTGDAPASEQMVANVFGLSELLTMYQDNRTIVMTVPQSLIYPLDIAHLKAETLALTKTKLSSLDVLTLDKQIDLLQAVFDSQIDIRAIPAAKAGANRPIDSVIAYPGLRLPDASTKGPRCRICGSAFDSKLPPKSDWPGHDFTDPEHLGFGNDICPLCRIYAVNSHKSRTSDEKNRGITGDRKALRGSFVLILPSSHFDVKDGDCQLIDRPPLDVGGRFDDLIKKPQRVTVTQQEYALFNQMSRRVIATLWRKVESTEALPLPYLGGILLTHREAEKVRKVLPALRALFAPVTLLAYPYEVKVTPGVEIALDVVLTDFKQHHTKHTYLKSRASILPVHPDSRLFVLADSKMQIELNHDWFDAYDRLATLAVGMSFSQRDEWLKRIGGESDILTAYFESAQTSLLKKRNDAKTAGGKAFSLTQDFGVKQFGDNPALGWAEYERKSTEIKRILDRYPMLPQLFSAMTERKEIEDDRRDTTHTSKKTDESSAGRGANRSRRTGVTKRPRARREARR